MKSTDTYTFRFGCPWTSKIFSDFGTPGHCLLVYVCQLDENGIVSVSSNRVYNSETFADLLISNMIQCDKHSKFKHVH